MSPELSHLLADLILSLHVGVVLFVVGFAVAILIGSWRGWRWVRKRGLRLTHMLLLAFIVLQTWLGQLCPLTVWEQGLRRQAGERGYHESFVEHWLSTILYVQAPWWAFVLVYSLFGALVLACWRWVPPNSR